MIYLDNAATSWPKPEIVYETLANFLRTAGANPGRGNHIMATRAAATIDETRLRLARLLGVADPRRVIFASNATDALNMAIKGVLKPGDHAVTTAMEHNSVRRPLHALEATGVSVTRVAADSEGFVAVEDIERALRPETRLIAMTHASNVNGAIQPVAEVARIAHDRGVLLLVDGAQTVGAMPVKMGDIGADLLAFPGHKGLLGPTGTGGLILGERIGPNDLATTREGGTGGNSEEDVQPEELPGRYEAGTVNTVGIAALGAALEVLSETGLDAVQAHEREITTQLIDGLSTIPGIRVLSPEDSRRRAAVVSIIVDGWEPSDFGAALDSSFEIACRTGLHCAPDACAALGAFPHGTIRLSPGFFTTKDEIDQAIGAVAELAQAALRFS
ncbi:MAG TPA: aminotransferase class V-fold PLP-dependent enzyme [Nitrolancea sp.]|nr:aminotransferase class V-fold PLP-dependent enzyme [Nitrolancea sp.]